MLLLSQTEVTPASFILTRIPGLDDIHIWTSFPFCSVYVMAVVGNCGLLYLIFFEDILHRSMLILIFVVPNDLVIPMLQYPKFSVSFGSTLRNLALLIVWHRCSTINSITFWDSAHNWEFPSLSGLLWPCLKNSKSPHTLLPEKYLVASIRLQDQFLFHW